MSSTLYHSGHFALCNGRTTAACRIRQLCSRYAPAVRMQTLKESSLPFIRLRAKRSLLLLPLPTLSFTTSSPSARSLRLQQRCGFSKTFWNTGGRLCRVRYATYVTSRLWLRLLITFHMNLPCFALSLDHFRHNLRIQNGSLPQGGISGYVGT